MNEVFTVRCAVPADARRLAELSEVLGYPTSPDAIATRLDRLLDRAAEVVLVAALPSGHVLGWLHGSEQELLESGRRCEILGLVVDADYRGQGVGRRLVAAVETVGIRAGPRADGRAQECPARRIAPVL